MFASSYGWAGVALGVLLILGTLWAFVRWVLGRGADRQAYLDTIERLKRERAEDARKLAAAQAALEVKNAATRDSAGLPADLGVQPRQKPIGGTLGQPPHRPEAKT